MYKIKELSKLNESLYHTDDLAVLWGITNRNTLTTTIYRYIRHGLLIPVQKGLYTTQPLDRVSAEKLGAALIHAYCYLSTETVLARAGVIFQDIEAFTFVSVASKRFQKNGYSYRVRQLSPVYLYQSAGISCIDGILTASPERAAADMLYFNKKYYFDAGDMLDWKMVKRIQKEVGYDR